MKSPRRSEDQKEPALQKDRRSLAADDEGDSPSMREGLHSAFPRNGKKIETPPAIVESKRPIQELLRDRVKFTHENTAVELDPNTPIEEYLAIYDHFVCAAEHVGFLIGDVIRFGTRAYGEKYDQAMASTGRALSTLKAYVNVASHIPPEMRKPRLSFSVHREVAKLKEKPELMTGLLKNAEAKAKAGTPPTVVEIRAEVVKLLPRKLKADAKVVSKPISNIPMTQDERVTFDTVMEQLITAIESICSAKNRSIVIKLNSTARLQWKNSVSPLLELAEDLGVLKS